MRDYHVRNLPHDGSRSQQYKKGLAWAMQRAVKLVKARAL